MGIWHIGADTLASSRFTVSRLAEAVATLHALNGRGTTPGHESAIREHHAAFRRRLAEDPVIEMFANSAAGPTWMPDFMCPPPGAEDRSFEDEIRRVREISPEVARTELARALPPDVLSRLAVPDLPMRVADLLEWIWNRAVRRDWPRQRRIFEADIVARTQQISGGGWAAALSGMRRGMHWLGDGRLQMNAYEYPPRHLSGDQLLFVPSTARRGWIAWNGGRRYAVVYPCRGLLAGPGLSLPSPALSKLLGPVRAGVLRWLDTPKSTSQLVALSGYGLGSVSGHLKVLLEAGLVAKRRSGRSVLYYRTGVGDQVVAAQHAAG